MAIHTIGTNATTSLLSLPAWSTVELQADVAAIAQSITGDGQFLANQGLPSAGQRAVLATGNTHSNTTLDTLVASPTTPPLTQIYVGDVVLGPGIAAGTFVSAIVSTTVTLSKAATSSTTGGHFAFVRYVRPGLDQIGFVDIPGGRGRLKVLPGDYVVLDPVTGWPILLSGNEVSYAGSVWTFT